MKISLIAYLMGIGTGLWWTVPAAATPDHLPPRPGEQWVSPERQPLSLSEALDRLQKQHEVNILYDDRLVNGLSVSGQSLARGGSVERKLTALLKPVGLTFQRMAPRKYLVVREPGKENGAASGRSAFHAPPSILPISTLPDAPLTVALSPAHLGTGSLRLAASALLVRGRVTDAETNEALPGVNVTVKGQSTGTTTDATGTFQLNVPGENTLLVFSYIGYKTQEVLVGKQTQLAIALQVGNRSLDEVVVVGYGTVRKSDLTGAVSQIKAADVNRAMTTSLDQMLQGRAAGVLVTQTSAAPGGGLQIRVRGTNSINGGAEPLYVVDGVPLNIDNNTNASFTVRGSGSNAGSQVNTLSSINPNDIESMEILKDASATAIYGSRGANGVVLITTKRGKAGSSTVDVDVSYGVQSPERRLSLLNAAQFYALNTEARANALGGGGTPNPLPAVPALNNEYGTDWQNALFRQAAVQNFQLSFRGGTEKTRYALSGNYFDQQGLVKGTAARRYAVRLNLDHSVGKRIKVGVNLAVSRFDTDLGFSDGASSLITSALRMVPNQPVTLNGIYLNNANPVDNFNAGVNLGLNAAGITSIVPSPLYYAELVTNQRTDDRVLGNFFAEVELLKGLSYRLNVGVDNLIARGIYYEPNNGGIRAAGGSSDRSVNTNLNTVIENTLNYNRTLGKHTFSAVIGQTAQKNVFDRLQVAGEGLNDNTGPYSYDGDYLVSLNRFANNNSWQMLSFLGRINYGFQEKYLLTASFRADGSSRFGAGNKFGYFPAVSAAWVLSKENFFAPLRSWASSVKLRAGYGQTGSQEIGLFRSLPILTSVITVFNNASFVGRQPGQIANPDLTWEKTSQLNVGLDVGLFDERLSLSANYYDKITDALLFNRSIPRTSGFSSVTQNLGSVSNRGWEVEVFSENLKGPFRWTTSLNVSANRNRIERLPVARAFVGDIILQEGVAVGSFYGFRTDGLFQLNDNTSIQTGAQPGERRFLDLTGDGRITPDDRTVLGVRDPTLLYGLNNNFSYKGLSLAIFLQGVGGNVIYNLTRANLLTLDGRFNNLTEALDRWTPTNTDTNIPRAIQAGSRNNYGSNVNDFFVERGDYLRLRNVTLSYRLPQPLSRQVKLTNARLYVSIDNLYTWTRYTGFNPDIVGSSISGSSNTASGATNAGAGTIGGIDNGPYPNPRVISAGLSLTF
jgi:TonB-linked SusC/RagA family outer membrane protein